MIASQQGVAVSEIIKNSALTNANLIYVGQKLTIKPEVKAKAKPISREIPAVTHTVQAGESLWQIAISKKYLLLILPNIHISKTLTKSTQGKN